MKRVFNRFVFALTILIMSCFCISTHGFASCSSHKADSCMIAKSQIKKELIIEVERYISKYAPMSKMSPDSIVEKCLTKNYDIRLLLAQAHLESHFGTAGRAKKTNSVFGIGAWDNGQSIHSYSSPNASIDHYIDHMNNYYLKGNPPLEVLKRGLRRDGYRYASDIDYENKVIRKINLINKHYKIYSYQQKYFSFKN